MPKSPCGGRTATSSTTNGDLEAMSTEAAGVSGMSDPSSRACPAAGLEVKELVLGQTREMLGLPTLH